MHVFARLVLSAPHAHRSRRTFCRHAGHNLWLLEGSKSRAHNVQVRATAVRATAAGVRVQMALLGMESWSIPAADRGLDSGARAFTCVPFTKRVGKGEQPIPVRTASAN